MIFWFNHLITHVQHVRQVLTHLLEHQLYVKGEKREFQLNSLHSWITSPMLLWTGSHIAVDFVQDLPVSHGHTVILTEVDQYSRGVRFITFLQLPGAVQPAETLFNHVFCFSGIPKKIVSDRGTQFTYQVWDTFMERVIFVMPAGSPLTSDLLDSIPHNPPPDVTCSSFPNHTPLPRSRSPEYWLVTWC